MIKQRIVSSRAWFSYVLSERSPLPIVNEEPVNIKRQETIDPEIQFSPCLTLNRE